MGCYCGVVAKMTRLPCDYQVSDQRISSTCSGLQPLFHIALPGWCSGMSPGKGGIRDTGKSYGITGLGSVVLA